MLVELSIRDLVLIEEAQVTLGPGLNVVSGETGAGKTLVVTSLELLLGLSPKGGAGRLVRQGAEEARVEGRFELVDEDRRRRFVELAAELVPELELDENDEELILGRRLNKEGRTRAHINQRPVPVKALRQLSPLLLEIHGQNEHQRLFEPAEQLRLYDGFAGSEKALGAYRAARSEWLLSKSEADRVRAEREERRDRLDLLRFQREELESARLEIGEHERLTNERDVLRRATELRALLGRWCNTLIEGEPAMRDTLRDAELDFERWEELLPGLKTSLEDVRSACVHVEEAGASLRTLLESVVDDPARLEEVEERLVELERLQNKYRTDEEGLLARHKEAQEELGRLEGEEAGAGELDAAAERARGVVAEEAKKLSKKRRAAAKKLTTTVEAVLSDLGLPKARFEPALETKTGADELLFSPNGTEEAEFLLAANPGQDPQPLRLVASGGEAARIMLALRTVLSAADRGRSLVFDEIDSGVGGRLGPEVGGHLGRLGKHHQVLCVTHLPAIAAQAETHVKVAKSTRAGRTRTTIELLEGDSRIAEVADMIAGGSKHESARAEARRLLEAR